MSDIYETEKQTLRNQGRSWKRLGDTNVIESRRHVLQRVIFGGKPGMTLPRTV